MTTVTTAKTINSREVAEMVEKQHKNLVRDIGIYIEILTSSKLSPLDFFIESTYMDAKGEERRCYEVTQKGCEMIAHKLTGQKGVIFTAKYINRFHEMEDQQTSFENLSPELRLLINLEVQQKQLVTQLEKTNERVDDIRDVVALNSVQWRSQTNKIINKIAEQLGGFEHISTIRQEIYKQLEERYGVNLTTRLKYKRQRMAEEGIAKSKRDKLNVVDIIGDDKKLIEGYVAIVKELAIKYGIAA